MKRLLIGYDGSPAAGAAIDDLVHACLPLPVEARVLSVAEVWLPPEAAEPGPSEKLGGTDREPALGRPDPDLYRKARAVLETSRATAAEGAQRLARLFPEWRVTAEAMADSPGWGLVERART